jgi:soluble lytic murein transglycosylase-like protein
MAAKSIVDIQINDGQFREFYEMYQNYEKSLGDMPGAWQKVSDGISEGMGEMGEFAKASKSSKESLMIAAIQADAISKGMARSTGVQDKFNTKAKDGAIQMSRMSKFSKDMHKSISGMSSILLKLGTAGVGGIGSAIGAIYNATNQLAGQNLEARGLGLKIGQTQAFESNFEKFGLGKSDLSGVSNAQSDVSKWRAFMTAGLTPEQIQSEDPEQLTFDFAKAASGKYREWQKSGMPAASMAQAYGFTDILSQQQLRTGASYSDADWQKAQQKEIADAKKNAVDQGTADTASDVKASLKSNWAEVMNTFNEQLGAASPELKIMGNAAAAASVSLMKIAGPQTKEMLKTLEGPPVSRADAAKSNTVTGAVARLGYAMRDLATFGHVGRHTATAIPGTKAGVPANAMAAMIDAQYTVESSRGKHLLSPVGAMGPMQFMKPTWDQWGKGDVNSLQDAQAAAQRYDAFLLKRYGGDNRKAMAAYNWGMGHLDKDIAAHGDKWEQYAPKETQQYIGKIEKLMAKQNVNINITNSTTANVATSMNAAPH